MKKTTLLFICGIVMAFNAAAQETELTPVEKLQQKVEAIESDLAKQKKLKVSGYIQTQYQWGEEKASLKVGSGNEKSDESFDRFGIRRGRVKFTYEEGIATGVFQLDITEKGVGFKDAYLNVKDPWMKSISLRAGIFDRPFGYEISYSSSRRESPERSRIFQTLFPDERDLGAMLILQAPKTSPWSALKLEAGMFAGNGINKETDNRKDFIGHLTYAKTFGNSFSVGLGASYYNGGVHQGNENVYKMKGKVFELNSDVSNTGEFAKREYIGFDAQAVLSSVLGLSQLRAEYIFGTQPGLAGSVKSPTYSTLPKEDTYIRDISGGYVMLVQDIGKLPFSAVLKYDWFDPNTEVSKNEIGEENAGTGKADLSYDTFGFGALWRINNNLRLQAFYEINKNEKSNSLDGFGKDVKDDVFTLRLQYKF